MIPIKPKSTESASINQPKGKDDKPKVDTKPHSEGRWTIQEQIQFVKGMLLYNIIALQKYGKKWDAIKTEIPSRSIVQIKTHSQKFFLKISKGLPPNTDIMEYVKTNNLSTFFKEYNHELHKGSVEEEIKIPKAAPPLNSEENEIKIVPTDEKNLPGIQQLSNEPKSKKDSVIISSTSDSIKLPASYMKAVDNAMKRLNMNIYAIKTAINNSINRKTKVIEKDELTLKYWNYLYSATRQLECILQNTNTIYYESILTKN